MINDYVGAGILNIITESLYDNPIVVFREYVQNSVDSIFREEKRDNLKIKIWQDTEDLCFLDNGKGVKADSFNEEMLKIADSSKIKTNNLGYKGIGRLSGLPYCGKLLFINIIDYRQNKVQCFLIDGEKYANLKEKGYDKGVSFKEIMQSIGTFYDIDESCHNKSYLKYLQKHDSVLRETNTGFLVVLENISPVLKSIMDEDGFFTNLQWLLPVDFEEDIYKSSKRELFEELTCKQNGIQTIPCCDISFNDRQIYRPIKEGMLRDYLCKNNLKYAVGFHSFYRNKIAIDRTNAFSGIRIYIDNMLLCTEDELLRNLDNYGLLKHTLNGQIQSVRGIGAAFYITDKVNISANARRTFIEVTDNDSLEFLKLIAEFVNTVYDTRYSLSNYINAKEKHDQNTEYISKLREEALFNLKKLAAEQVELPAEDCIRFNELSINEKKRLIKKKISEKFDNMLKQYLDNQNDLCEECDFDSFIEWLVKH